MAWVTPPTGTAGTILTAATWNQVRDDLKALLPLDQLAWTSYTPTLTQSGAVTKTVNYAKYTRLGNLVLVQIHLSCTGAGTAANAVTVSLPVTAAIATNSPPRGEGWVVDISAGPLRYRGIVYLASTTTAAMWGTTGTANSALGSSEFTAALASTDEVAICLWYEV